MVANPRPFVAIKLRELLVERGCQEQVLAYQLKITKSALSRKLNGSRPWKLEQMDDVAAYLGLPTDEVFPMRER